MVIDVTFWSTLFGCRFIENFGAAAAFMEQAARTYCCNQQGHSYADKFTFFHN